MKLQKGWYSKVKKSNLNRKKKISEGAGVADDMIANGEMEDTSEDSQDGEGGDIPETTTSPSNAASGAAEAEQTAEANANASQNANDSQQQQNGGQQQAQNSEQNTDSSQQSNAPTNPENVSNWDKIIQEADNAAQNNNASGKKYNMNDPSTFGGYLKAYCENLFSSLSQSVGNADAIKKEADSIVKETEKSDQEVSADNIKQDTSEITNNNQNKQ